MVLLEVAGCVVLGALAALLFVGFLMNFDHE